MKIEDAVSITFDQKLDDWQTGSSVVGVKYKIESLSKFRHDMIKQCSLIVSVRKKKGSFVIFMKPI
jgi:hypothetical protein